MPRAFVRTHFNLSFLTHCVLVLTRDAKKKGACKMLKNLVIAIAICFPFSGCDKPSESADWPALVSSHPFFYSGQLPETKPNRKIAKLQKRVQEDLKIGFLPEAFEGLRDPDATIIMFGRSNNQPTWVMNDQRRVAHLVIRHLKRAKKSEDYPANFCAKGRVYSGFIAARPYTQFDFHSTALQTTTVIPYGLFVCDTGSTLTYKLVSDLK